MKRKRIKGNCNTCMYYEESGTFTCRFDYCTLKGLKYKPSLDNYIKALYQLG